MWSRANFAPILFLWVDGKPASDLLRITTSFTHKMSVAKAAETVFVMRNDKRKLLDDPRTFPNRVWQFRYGFLNDLSPLYTAILRNVEPKYRDKRIVNFTLYDASLNLSQKSSAKTWGTIPSCEIARRIAKAHGLEPLVDESNDKPKNAFVQPATTNDLQYLRDLAVNIDFEVFVDQNKLYYRKKPYDASPHKILTYYDDPTEFAYVLGFEPKVKSLGPLKTGASSANTGSKGKDGKSAASTQGKGGALAGYVTVDGNNGKSTYTPPPKPTIDIGDASLALAASSIGGAASPLVSAAILAASPVSKMKDQITKAAPGGSNAASLAAAARSQMLDKANEASSDHPLTPSIIIGRTYEWRGIEKQLNGKWYCHEGEDQITGTGASSKRSWKRNTKGAGDKKADNKNNKDATGKDGKDGANGAGGKKAVEINGDTGNAKLVQTQTTAK